MSFLLDSYLLSLLGDGLPGFDVMNIFLQAEDVPSVDSSMELFLFSTTDAGILAGLDLTLVSDDGEISDSMNLFCHASDPMGLSGVMNLFVSGSMHPMSSDVPLVLANDQAIIDSGVSLVVVGDGETDGALPTGDSMNLVIQRDPNEVIPLCLCSNTPEDESLSLYIQAASSLETGGLGDDWTEIDLMSPLDETWTGPFGMPLIIPSTASTESGSSKLFIHGF